jgi:hypothetical protein
LKSEFVGMFVLQTIILQVLGAIIGLPWWISLLACLSLFLPIVGMIVNNVYNIWALIAIWQHGWGIVGR